MSRFVPLTRQLARPAFAPKLYPRSIATTAVHTNPPAQKRVPGLPELSLKDKVVVVSGGGRGLGLVQAEALCEAGATVHAIDRLESPVNDPKSDFSVVAARAQAELGTTLSYHRADVRKADQINAIFKEIADQQGRLDGLIAAAGVQYEAPALEYPQEQAERVMNINVVGVFLTAQAAARQMARLKRPGSIAMIASMSGTVANRGLYSALYNSSKAAVIQLGRSLAAEWGQQGIRVNTLSPGYIQTKMLLDLFDEFPERKIRWSSENMLGRLSSPEEYRGAGVFLMSDASSFMTGGDLRIDGGHTAW